MYENKNAVPRIFIISLFLMTLSLISLFISVKNSEFAAGYSSTVGALYRLIPLCVSNFVDIPLAEAALYLSPFFIVIVLVYALSSFSDKAERRKRTLKLTSFLMLFISSYISVIGISYYKSPSEGRVGIREIALAAEKLCGELSKTEAEYLATSQELTEAINIAYSSRADNSIDTLPVFPKIKLARSEYLFSKLGILGTYSFPSSEVLINPEAPDYTKPFSAAHECAHLYGIAREDEASLCAFVTLYLSENSALKYSATLCALEYLLEELKVCDIEKYREIVSNLPESAKKNLRLGADFAKLSDNRVGDASREANDKVISVFDSDGEDSYSRFSYLVTAYLLSQNQQ